MESFFSTIFPLFRVIVEIFYQPPFFFFMMLNNASGSINVRVKTLLSVL